MSPADRSPLLDQSVQLFLASRSFQAREQMVEQEGNSNKSVFYVEKRVTHIDFVLMQKRGISLLLRLLIYSCACRRIALYIALSYIRETVRLDAD